MAKQDKQFSFSAYAWGQFKKNKPAYISLWILGSLALIALFAPILANDQPLFAKYKGQTVFPVFSFEKVYEFKNADGSIERVQLDIAKWKQMNLDAVVWAPVVYASNKSDFLNSDYKSPGSKQFFKNKEGQIVDMPVRFRHFLGTNKKGEDVLSGLIHAARISLSIGILSMGIATMIGLVLGAMAGYFGDNRLVTTRGRFWTFIIGIILAYFYGFQVQSSALADAVGTSSGALLAQLAISIGTFVGVLVLFSFIGKLIGKLPFLNAKTNIAVDSTVSRLIEILVSVPSLILILSIAAIAKASMVNLMLIIGLTGWTGIARLTRAEFLKIRNLEYIQAGQALGFSEVRIIFRHALPNGIGPAFVVIAFGVAGAILAESSLSFLGVGVPPELVTWGSLVNSGRAQFNAWWLVIFPGMAIFTTVAVYNLLGDGLRDALDPRLKT